MISLLVTLWHLRTKSDQSILCVFEIVIGIHGWQRYTFDAHRKYFDTCMTWLMLGVARKGTSAACNRHIQTCIDYGTGISNTCVSDVTHTCIS